MAEVELELNLPDGLAREAAAEGLLTSQTIELLLRQELRRRGVKNLFDSADKFADYKAPVLTEEEVEAEIQAARQEPPYARRRRP